MASWRIVLWVGLVAVTAWFLYSVRGILLPFVLAWLIAVILEPVVRRLRQRGMSRGWAVSLITLAFFVVSGAFLVVAIPQVNGQILEFQKNIQALTTRLAAEDANNNLFVRWNPAVRAQAPGTVGWIDRIFEDASPTLDRFGLPTNRREFIEQYVEPRRAEITGIVQNFFNGFLGILGGAASKLFLLLFTPLFVFMILLDLEEFRARWVSWVPPSLRAETVSIVTDIGDVFKKYLRGVLMVVALYTLVMACLFTFIGMPYGVLLALIAGALYLIPLLGPMTSGITVFVVTGFSGVTGNWLVSTNSSWSFALVLAGTFIVFSTAFDQLLYPRLVGKAVDLHPLVSMFVVFSGGAIFGLPGMLVAFPLAGSIKVVLGRLMRMTTKSTVEVLGLPAVPLRHQ